MTTQVVQPFAMFFDENGSPLDNGYIYIGTVNLNPETNPVACYWDIANTLPAAQPIRTINGFPSRNGHPATIYTAASSYSITVRNVKTNLVYYTPDGIKFDASLINYTPPGAGGVVTTVASKLGDIVNTSDYNSIANYDAARAALATNYNDLLVKADEDNVPNLIGERLTHLRTQKPAAYSFPRFFRTISSYRTDLAPAINIVGYGSSVGVGATLPDAATQAPVAKFSSILKSVVDPANIFNFVTYNDSVNGSTVSQAQTALAGSIAAGHTPKICVLAYGMNDGEVAIFNSGQTYPAVYTSIMKFVTSARASGADVILMTTPHHKCSGFSYTMPGGVDQLYPTFVANPVGPEQLIPPASASNITADFLGTGVNLTASHRHLRVNQAMRQAATDAGIPLIDVERYWFKAVAKYGEDALFNPGETVHPNLLGHQNSYWLAIKEFIESLGWQTAQEGQEPRLNGLVGVNKEVPAAVVDIDLPYPDTTTPPLQVRARVGAPDANAIPASVVVWKVDPANGDLVGYAAKTTDSSQIEVYRHHYVMDGTGTVATAIEETHKFANTQFRRETTSGLFNVNGVIDLATVIDNSYGSLYVNGFQSGIGRKRIRVEWFANGGAITFGVIEAIGAGVFTGPTATGLILQVTTVAAGTNLSWKVEMYSGI